MIFLQRQYRIISGCIAVLIDVHVIADKWMQRSKNKVVVKQMKNSTSAGRARVEEGEGQQKQNIHCFCFSLKRISHFPWLIILMSNYAYSTFSCLLEAVCDGNVQKKLRGGAGYGRAGQGELNRKERRTKTEGCYRKENLIK